jgi:hypothetical protein
MEAVQSEPETIKLEAVPLASRGAQGGHPSRPRRGAGELTSAPDDALAVQQAVSGSYSIFVPMLLMLLSLLLWFGFQGVQLWKERTSFAEAVQRQVPRVERAQQFRSEFESFSADTAHLAAVGNANARQLVDALKQRGWAIDAEKSAPAGAGTQGPR